MTCFDPFDLKVDEVQATVLFSSGLLHDEYWIETIEMQ